MTTPEAAALMWRYYAWQHPSTALSRYYLNQWFNLCEEILVSRNAKPLPSCS